MSKGVKIALVFIVVLLALCCIGSLGSYFIYEQYKQVANQASTDDPVRAAKIGQEIVTYTLPPGYREQSATDVLLFKTVSIGPESEAASPMTLTLTQFMVKSHIDQAARERQAKQLQTDCLDNLQPRFVGIQKTMIKGQRVTLTITDSCPTRLIRILSGTFNGDNGSVMLMAMGSPSDWDQEMLDSFLASIR